MIKFDFVEEKQNTFVNFWFSKATGSLVPIMFRKHFHFMLKKKNSASINSNVKK